MVEIAASTQVWRNGSIQGIIIHVPASELKRKPSLNRGLYHLSLCQGFVKNTFNYDNYYL